MAFVTDLIWRSPLGLRINAQATADVLMTEDWVKVRGDQLVPRDGAYDLRVTAELWETHFFDLVSLLVVDHPEGTEVFVDERFAVPPPALEPIVDGPGAASSRRCATTAGSDVAEVVRGARRPPSRLRRPRRLPGRHARPLRRDGAARGRAARRARSGSSAQGWVHPTDSSVNVALGQGAHAPPQGLSLHVADAAGRFREVRAGPRLPRGQGQDGARSISPGLFPATRAAAAAPLHQPGDLSGTGWAGRRAGPT